MAQTDEEGHGGWIESLREVPIRVLSPSPTWRRDYYTAPSNDLKLFRETANRLGKAYFVGLKDEGLLSGTPAEIRAEVKSIIKQLYPCNVRLRYRTQHDSHGYACREHPCDVQALDDFGTYPIDLTALTRTIKCATAPLSRKRYAVESLHT